MARPQICIAMLFEVAHLESSGAIYHEGKRLKERRCGAEIECQCSLDWFCFYCKGGDFGQDEIMSLRGCLSNVETEIMRITDD